MDSRFLLGVEINTLKNMLLYPGANPGTLVVRVRTLF